MYDMSIAERWGKAMPPKFSNTTSSSSSSGSNKSVRDGETPKRQRKEVRDDEFLHKPRIIKADVPKVVIEKKIKEEPKPEPKLEEAAPEAPPEPKEEKAKRKVKTKVYRGNMNLVTSANKDAARALIQGKKVKYDPNKKKKTQGHKKSGLTLCMRRICCCFTIHEDVMLQDEKAKLCAKALDLSQDDLKRMKIVFEEIDVDDSGNIDVPELFEFLGEKRSPFTDALFALMDMDGNGVIEFEEFIRVLCAYCMYTEEDILKFCFDCFDKDGSGTIDENEFIVLCQTVNNGQPLFQNNFKKALEAFDVNEDGLIDFQEFTNTYRKFPMILYPAFRLQDHMQRLTLGENRWLKLHENIQMQRRLLQYREMNNGKDPPVSCAAAACRCCCPCLFPEIKISPTLLKEFGSQAAAGGAYENDKKNNFNNNAKK